MDKALKEKWVKALRSGDYKQANGQLKNGAGEYCCLGVLCNIIGAKWKLEFYGELSPFIDGKRADHETENELRPSFLRRVGLTKPRQKTLIEMNDGDPSKHIEPQTFQQIADYIEKNL